jgi:DNA-binding response OmpR family regulator
MTTCPNCGYQHSTSPYAPELACVRLSQLQRSVLLRLMDARGALVSNDQIVDSVYRDRSDGGPDSARNCVQSSITRIRKKIEPLGWEVTWERFSGYRLVRKAGGEE